VRHGAINARAKGNRGIGRLDAADDSKRGFRSIRSGAAGRGALGEGLVSAVEQVGAVLKAELPGSHSDNQLPNHAGPHTLVGNDLGVALGEGDVDQHAGASPRSGDTPRRWQRERAHAAARREFFAHGLTGTRGRTGVLVYVALAERYAEIVADKGVRVIRRRSFRVSSSVTSTVAA
jgi:hypothetical protein